MLVDVFDGEGGLVVELEVLLLRAGPEGDVGLVPDFEFPGAHFWHAVAVDTVIGEGVDHVVPILPVAGRGDVALVRKDAVGAGGERLRHEAELDEWPHAVVEHEVVDLVDVEEIEVSGSSWGNAHLVVEEAVAANGLDSGFVVDADEILSAIGRAGRRRCGPSRRLSPSSAEAVLRFSLCLLRLRGHCQEPSPVPQPIRCVQRLWRRARCLRLSQIVDDPSNCLRRFSGDDNANKWPSKVLMQLHSKAQKAGTRLFEMTVEEVGQGLHGFMRLRHFRMFPENVPHAFKDVEVGVDSGIAQFAMQKDGLAEAHIACAGEQKCRRIAFGYVAIERGRGWLAWFARNGVAAAKRRLTGEGAREGCIEAVECEAGIAGVRSAGASVEAHCARQRKILLREPEDGGLRERASA